MAGGHVTGTVVNVGREPVGELELFTFDGQNAHMAPVSNFLGSGGTASVDGQLGSSGPNGAQSAPSPGTLGSLLQAVASSELHEQGQAVLVGLTVPVPSNLTVDGGPPPRLAVAVLQQPVTLEAADGSLRDLEQKRLASSVGDSSSG